MEKLEKQAPGATSQAAQPAPRAPAGMATAPLLQLHNRTLTPLPPAQAWGHQLTKVHGPGGTENSPTNQKREKTKHENSAVFLFKGFHANMFVLYSRLSVAWPVRLSG